MILQKYRELLTHELFLNGPVVIFIWKNEKNWPVGGLSANVKRVLGYKKEDFLTKKINYEAIIHKDDVAKAAQELVDATQKNYTFLEHTPYRIKKQDGTYIWVHDATAIIKEDGVITHYIGYIIDITKQKNLELELQASHQRWNFAIEGNGDGLWDWNVVTSEVFFSTQWKKMLGFEEHEVKNIFEEWARRVHPEDLPNVNKDIETYLEGKSEQYQNEHRILCKDGSYRWVLARGVAIQKDENNKPVRIIGTHSDITARRLYQKEHVFLENVFQNAEAVIVAIDKQGRMIEFNRYAQEFSGYTKEEISSEPYFWEVLLPDSVKPYIKEMIDSANSGSILQRHENSWISKTGQEKAFEWSNSLIFNDKKEVEYILSVGIDVSIPKELNQKMEDYVNLIDEHILTSSTDIDGKITDASNAFCKVSGYTKMELIGKNHSLLRHPDMPNQLFQELWESITSGKTWEGEIKNKAKDGTAYWVHNVISPLLDKKSNIAGYTAISQNITDKKRVEELSIRDSLTGLFNRLKLDNVLEYKLSLANRYETPLSVIILDVDYFKKVNDEHGHQVGDSVLKEFAQILQVNAREVDIVGRWGGEEFLIILPQTSLEDAMGVAEKLRKKIETFHFLHVGHKTSSFGVASYVKGEREVQLIERADTALYKAKKNGRNRVES